MLRLATAFILTNVGHLETPAPNLHQPDWSLDLVVDVSVTVEVVVTEMEVEVTDVVESVVDVVVKLVSCQLKKTQQTEEKKSEGAKGQSKIPRHVA